jgi:DNA-directed RNA polymerase specialized sigma24 family protein
MSVDIGSSGPEDRHSPRSPTGDLRERFVAFALSYAAHLLDYAGALLHDPAVAADVVESILIAAAEQFDDQDDDLTVSRWLYAAVRRECQARRLSGRAAPAGAAGLPDSPFPDLGAAQVAGAQVVGPAGPAEERGRQVAAVRYVLGRLPERDRELLNLAFRHELDDDDLAAILRISADRVHDDLSVAQERFTSLIATVVLLPAGRLGCGILNQIAGDETSAVPGDRLCHEVAQHSWSCDTCGPIVASQGFGLARLNTLPIADLTPAFDHRLSDVAQSLEAEPSTAADIPYAEPVTVAAFEPEPAAAPRPGSRARSRSAARHRPQAAAAVSRPASWLRAGLTRPRVAAISALAVLVVVAGMVLVGKLAFPAAVDSSRATSVSSTSAQGSQPEPTTLGRASRHRSRSARPRTITTTVPIPGRSGFPTYSPPVAPSPRPSSSKPSPSPTRHSKSPSPTPTSTLTPTPSPDPFPTTPTPTPTSTSTLAA